jgi:hypothetical protein
MIRRALAALVVAAGSAFMLPGATAAGRPSAPGECRGHEHGHGNGKGHEKGRGKGHERHCDDDGDGGGGSGGGDDGTGGGGTGGDGTGGTGAGVPAPGVPGAGDLGVGGTPLCGPAAGLAQDSVVPLISRPALRPARFRAARRGPAIAAAPVGTRIRYRLSEPARVRFTVLKARLTVRRCRIHVQASRHRRCIRYRSRGRFTHVGATGVNSFRFRGRVKGRRLPPGRYRLVSRAIDASGNRSLPRRVRFDIVR